MSVDDAGAAKAVKRKKNNGNRANLVRPGAPSPPAAAGANRQTLLPPKIWFNHFCNRGSHAAGIDAGFTSRIQPCSQQGLRCDESQLLDGRFQKHPT
jgi:hypothetical protein